MTDTWPKETIISFIEGEDDANVFTYSEKWQKHMGRLGVKAYQDNGHGGNDYTIPKKWIRLPMKTRMVSEARRVASASALMKARARRQTGRIAPETMSPDSVATPSTPKMGNPASSATRGAK
ncbi:MAG: hypothetical protein WC455_15585 [Dehalococcoidia bacterium]|jgi:hypothetical protein